METIKAYKVVNNVNGKLVSALAGNVQYWLSDILGKTKTYTTRRFTVCNKNPMGVFLDFGNAKDFMDDEMAWGGRFSLNLELWECKAVIVNPEQKPFKYRGTSYASHVKLTRKL